MNKEDVIYGLRAIIEAIEANTTLNKVYLQKGLSGALFKQLEHLVHKKKINCSYVPVEKLNKLSKNNHQGAIAMVSPVTFQDFDILVEQLISAKETPLFLLLDGVTDVRNFGAIIRTAECTGVDAIIVPKTGAAPVNSDTIKTSAGAAFNVPLVKVHHLKDAVYYFQGSNIPVIAATEKADTSIYDLDFIGPAAIVMGAEDKGVSSALLQLVDQKVKLPLLGSIASLNVAVACGVTLYEVVRQRLKGQR
ncbi:MAG: 23S rRNA (guanosine(2251)-2'-O)-methyltransferase RlmB [Bacteroidota bacterium]